MVATNLTAFAPLASHRHQHHNFSKENIEYFDFATANTAKTAASLTPFEFIIPQRDNEQDIDSANSNNYNSPAKSIFWAFQLDVKTNDKFNLILNNINNTNTNNKNNSSETTKNHNQQSKNSMVAAPNKSTYGDSNWDDASVKPQPFARAQSSVYSRPNHAPLSPATEDYLPSLPPSPARPPQNNDFYDRFKTPAAATQAGPSNVPPARPKTPSLGSLDFSSASSRGNSRLYDHNAYSKPRKYSDFDDLDPPPPLNADNLNKRDEHYAFLDRYSRPSVDNRYSQSAVSEYHKDDYPQPPMPSPQAPQKQDNMWGSVLHVPGQEKYGVPPVPPLPAGAAAANASAADHNYSAPPPSEYALSIDNHLPRQSTTSSSNFGLPPSHQIANQIRKSTALQQAPAKSPAEGSAAAPVAAGAAAGAAGAVAAEEAGNAGNAPEEGAPPRPPSHTSSVYEAGAYREPEKEVKFMGLTFRDKKSRNIRVGVIAFLILLLIIAIILAAVLIPKSHKSNEDDSDSTSTPDASSTSGLSWVTAADYPALPTGISTVAGANAHVQHNSCAQPSSLWSCAVPPDELSENKPQASDSPKFRMAIFYEKDSAKKGDDAASLGSKDLFGNNYVANPPVPSLDDMQFLGKTTDNITSSSYSGEATPFWVSFIPTNNDATSRFTRRNRKRMKFRPRASGDNNNATDNDGSDGSLIKVNGTMLNIDMVLPTPEVDSDGTAGAASLYPLVQNQPLRLFNRGDDTEHYGFYTYYDRSLFLSELRLNENNTFTDSVAGDLNGGAKKNDAKLRCTFSSTRFHVQIFTQPDKMKAQLIKKDLKKRSDTASSAAFDTSTDTAQDFDKAPGSFPYPVSITIDRHGGVAKEKMLYCFSVDKETHKLSRDSWAIMPEERGSGGNITSPGPTLFTSIKSQRTSGKRDAEAAAVDSDHNSTDAIAELRRVLLKRIVLEDVETHPPSRFRRDRGSGVGDSIDGGSGGCSCQYRNWNDA